MNDLTPGTLLRWKDPQRGQKPLGIVIPPRSGSGDEDMIFVLMADLEGNKDVEVFVGRPEATGYSVANLVLQDMEIEDDPEPALAVMLAAFGPHWWQISAHFDGEHDEVGDPECVLCGQPDVLG